MEILKREGRLRPSAYMKTKGRLRPSGYKIYKRRLGYNCCKLKEDLLKNETEGSFYRLEEALDSSGDC